MKKNSIGQRLGIAALFTFLLPSYTNLQAQRLVPELGRGVVATSRNGQTLISWRRMAQDPEGACYNVYVNGAKVNSQLLSSSCLSRSLKAGDQVTVTVTDKKGRESEPSTAWTYQTPEWNNVYMHIDFKKAGSPLDNANYGTKFCWPIDLTGDGEYDYVVTRNWTGSGYGYTNRDSRTTDCLEGYSHDGKHLWTVALGPNIFLGKGQNDGATVGDFDCDGVAEVMVQASDSCRLWDATHKTWGSWMKTDTNDGSSPDADGDGQINYTHGTRNPQYYMLVVNGRTGEQKDCVMQTNAKDHEIEYTRTNKSFWMGDEYSYPFGAMGTAYLDGIHPSAVVQFQVRTSQGAHHYFNYGYGYRDGVFQELYTFAFADNGHPSEFHHLREGDVDQDGKDETMNGAFALDHDGKVLWNSGINHGDRFRLSDIDPDRPGQEIFAIQQNAPDMLGQLIYSATDGKSIKRWYLGSVGDTGRGECMDVMPEHKGYEIWSTMPNMYSCKGELLIEGLSYGSSAVIPYPTEGMWWDGELDREQVNAADAKENVDIRKFNYTAGGKRLIEMAKESGWKAKSESAIRPMFWGDIYGDWREEMVLKVVEDGVTTGFVGYTTNYSTSVNYIYHLQQDPNYHGQCTNRGYYQSPNTSFYLGFGMPRPALPPYLKAERVWTMVDQNWKNEGEKSVLFGLNGNSSVTIDGEINGYDSILFVVPKADLAGLNEAEYVIQGTGEIASGEIWKTGAGALALANGIHITSPDSVYISEGTLRLEEGAISSPVSLRARGTLAGKVTLKGGLTLEGALNYVGGRLMPDGAMMIEGDWCIGRPLTLTLANPLSDRLAITGTLSVTDSITLVLPEEIEVGDYTILTANVMPENCHIGILGHELMQYHWTIEDNKQLILHVDGYTVKEPRTTPDNIYWTGAADGTTWDFETENWALSDGTPTNFVNGDHVTISNTANGASIKLDKTVKISGLNIDNQYTLPIVGTGAITGPGALVKQGEGQFSLSVSGTCNYSGGTYLEEGSLAQGQYTVTFGRAGDTIHVANGKLQQFYTTSTGNAPTFNYVYDIAEPDDELYITETGRGKVTGKAIGQGTLSLYNNYVRCDNTINLSDFEGTLALYSPSDYADHRFNNTTVEMKKARLHLDASARAQGYKAGSGTSQNNTWNVGSLSGTGTLGSGTWNVGYDNTDFKMECKSSGITFHKYGNGVMECGTNLSFAPTIHAGVMFFKNSSANSTPTTGLITVANGGTLQSGGGYANQVKVQSGGTLRVSPLAYSIAKATCRLTELTAQSGAKIAVRYCLSGYDYIEVSGKATVTNPHFLIACPANQITGNHHQWAAGDTLKCLRVTDAANWLVTGTVTVETEEGSELPDGLVWDTSTFLIDGVLRVAEDPNGLSRLWRDEEGNPIVYDLSGRRVQQPIAGHMYLIDGKKQEYQTY